jgi:hypothetical protein
MLCKCKSGLQVQYIDHKDRPVCWSCADIDEGVKRDKLSQVSQNKRLSSIGNSDGTGNLDT